MEYQFIRTQLEFTTSTHSRVPTQIYWIRSHRLRPSNLCFCRPLRWFSGTLEFENTILGWIAFPNSDSPPLHVSKEKRTRIYFMLCIHTAKHHFKPTLTYHFTFPMWTELPRKKRSMNKCQCPLPHSPQRLCVPAPWDEDPWDQAQHQNFSRWLGSEINSTNFLYMVSFKLIKV